METFTKFFSAMIFVSVLLDLMDFSDIVIYIVIVGQIVVANKTLSILVCFYYPKVCFHERVAMTVKQIYICSSNLSLAWTHNVQYVLAGF